MPEAPWKLLVTFNADDCGDVTIETLVRYALAHGLALDEVAVTCSYNNDALMVSLDRRGGIPKATLPPLHIGFGVPAVGNATNGELPSGAPTWPEGQSQVEPESEPLPQIDPPTSEEGLVWRAWCESCDWKIDNYSVRETCVHTAQIHARNHRTADEEWEVRVQGYRPDPKPAETPLPVRRAWPDDKVQCADCDFRAQNPTGLAAHRRHKHAASKEAKAAAPTAPPEPPEPAPPAPPGPPHHCPDCSFVTASVIALDAHMAAESHGFPTRSTVEGPSYDCPDCPKSFDTRSGLAEHEAHAHPVTPAEPTPSEPVAWNGEGPKPSWEKGCPMLVCRACPGGSWYTDHPATLAEHTKAAHNRLPTLEERRPVSDAKRAEIVQAASMTPQS